MSLNLNNLYLLPLLVCGFILFSLSVNAKDNSNVQEADAESIKALNLMQNAIEKMDRNHANVGDSKASGSLTNNQGALTDENAAEIEGLSNVSNGQKQSNEHKK